MSDPDRIRRLRLAQMQAQARAGNAQAPAAPERGPGAVLYDNLIGDPTDGVDSYGEQLGRGTKEVLRSVFPGIARGTAELAGLPGTIDNAIMGGLERVGVLQPSVDEVSGRNPLSGSSIRDVVSALTGGATEYRSETPHGRIAGTVGEFLPGAGGAGVRGLMAYGVAPGVASEAAGMVTEGTAAEPYARIIAALAAPTVAGPMAGLRSQSVRAPGANPEQRRIAELLQDQGIQPTAGQTTGSNMLRRMEGTVSPRPNQIEAVTESAMRSIGSTAARATPETLSAAQSRIVGVMDDALQGVSVRPSTAMAQAADDVVAQYLEMAPSVTVVPRVRNIAAEITDAATSPSAAAIDLTTLRQWRSALGAMTQSADEATRTAAQGLRRIIDDATDAALTSAGRSEDLARLSGAREQYRNFLAVSDASTRAGAASGVLSPQQLNQAIIRTQGRDAYAVGRGTNLMETSRAAGEVLRPMPTVEAGGIRRLPYVGELGVGGAGAALGFGVGGVPGALVGGALGALTPPTSQAIMRSSPVQGALMNPGGTAGNALRTVPGILAGQ